MTSTTLKALAEIETTMNALCVHPYAAPPQTAQPPMQSVHLFTDTQEKLLETFTPEDELQAVEMAEQCGAKVKDFGIRILNINPRSLEVIAWERIPGFSVWQ